MDQVTRKQAIAEIVAACPDYSSLSNLDTLVWRADGRLPYKIQSTLTLTNNAQVSYALANTTRSTRIAQTLRYHRDWSTCMAARRRLAELTDLPLAAFA